jgi:hypothetical protein
MVRLQPPIPICFRSLPVSLPQQHGFNGAVSASFPLLLFDFLGIFLVL